MALVRKAAGAVHASQADEAQRLQDADSLHRQLSDHVAQLTARLQQTEARLMEEGRTVASMRAVTAQLRKDIKVQISAAEHDAAPLRAECDRLRARCYELQKHVDLLVAERDAGGS